MARRIIAPMSDIMKPADCPSPYHPTARPIHVAATDPAMPSRAVTIHPPGSFPGIMRLGQSSNHKTYQHNPSQCNMSPEMTSITISH